MALKNLDNNQYYKINIDLCKIMGGLVYSNYSIYLSERERLKEKTRFAEQIKFNQALRAYIATEIKAIDDEFIRYEFDPYNPDDNQAKVPTDVLQRLQNKADFNNKFIEIENILTQSYWKHDDKSLPIPDLSVQLPKLMELGFNPEWVRDPVLLGIEIESQCGNYSGEPITYELFYSKLKSVLGNPVQDC